MNISDAYPRRKSQNANYGYNNTLSTLTAAQESTDFAGTYDYVMVFPMKGDNHDAQTKWAKHCIHEMLSAGLEVFPYLSVQFDELLVMIRCPVRNIQKFYTFYSFANSFFLLFSFFLLHIDRNLEGFHR